MRKSISFSLAADSFEALRIHPLAGQSQVRFPFLYSITTPMYYRQPIRLDTTRSKPSDLTAHSRFCYRERGESLSDKDKHDLSTLSYYFCFYRARAYIQ